MEVVVEDYVALSGAGVSGSLEGEWEGMGTMEMVMTVGLGMYTVPIMFVPSASGVSSMVKLVTVLFKPRSRRQQANLGHEAMLEAHLA